MTKQKKGFWLFIFSLLPGAGELYMGFRKMGLSIMGLFFGIIACASMLNLNALIFFMPLIWFYSFFNVHNIKSLTPEEFAGLEDDYIFHLDALITDKKDFVKKYRSIVAALLIIIGISGLWNTLVYWITPMLPEYIREYIYDLGYNLPTMAISVIMIVIGVKLVKGKREALNQDENA